MARYLISRLGLAVAAATLALSPRARRMARKGLASVGSAAVTVGKTVARGTRNLQEAEKHVTKFAANAADGGPAGSTEGSPPPAS